MDGMYECRGTGSTCGKPRHYAGEKEGMATDGAQMDTDAKREEGANERLRRITGFQPVLATREEERPGSGNSSSSTSHARVKNP